MINSVYARSHVNSSYSRPSVRFANSVTVGLTAMSLRRVGAITSTRQDLRITNVRAKLYAQISLSLVLNAAGFSTLSRVWRKNVSCLKSTVSINDTDLINSEFITVRHLATSIVALIPAKVMI
jgi:hypothetical protein